MFLRNYEGGNWQKFLNMAGTSDPSFGSLWPSRLLPFSMEYCAIVFF